MKIDRWKGSRFQNRAGCSRNRNRVSYLRQLRVESLETRALMAADCMGVQDLFSTQQRMAGEGESPAPILGFIPPPPADLSGTVQPTLG